IYAARHDEGFVLQENGRKGLIGARAIRTYDGNILGYLVVTLWEEGIESLFRGRYSSVNNVILLDPTWRAAYYSQSAQGLATTGALREQLLNGEPLTGREGEFNFYVREFGDDGFTLILQQPRTFTSAVMRSLYSVSAITGLLCLILCLGCAWVLSRHLSKPVDELDTAMREVEKGNYEIQLETSRTDEFGRLASSFNR
ncbi:MAG TPA: HAMP domain-containing protein, partial [Candidatus Avimonas sp.]|nr:HAMP domain-containing protein [Candidatus Avimonas sp.]